VQRELKRQYLEYGDIIKTLKIGRYKEKYSSFLMGNERKGGE
jgi:hypothetical protein